MEKGMIKIKIRRFLEIPFLYKNWVKVLLDRFKILKVDFLKLRNGLKFYTGDIPSARPIVSHTFSKWEGYDIFHEIKEGDIIIDIGAFIGDFSIKAIKKGAIVYAYEPYKKVYEVLEKNIKINDFKGKIFMFNKGIYKEAGRSKLFIREDYGVNSMINTKRLDHRSKLKGDVEIELMTFEQMWDINKIKECDFLKIDAEGVEVDIILSIPKEILKKIKYISAKSTDYIGNGEQNLELINYLFQHGFNVQLFDESIKTNKDDNKIIRIFAENVMLK